MEKIRIAENKTLKLQNSLSVNLDFSTENLERIIDNEVNKMNTYIQTHGARQVGPLIQYASVEVNDEGEADINMKFILQADTYIHNVEPPYHMESLLRVTNCLYARYIGPEDKVKFVYDKLGVYAFENDIELEGSNYTIYVDRNEEEETIIADVFMPIKQ